MCIYTLCGAYALYNYQINRYPPMRILGIPQRACTRELQYSVCVSASQSVSQSFCHTTVDLEDGSLPKIEKHQNVVLDNLCFYKNNRKAKFALLWISSQQQQYYK